MHVEGLAKVNVCVQNVCAALNVAVSSDLKESLLIRCGNLCKLHFIPADFPAGDAIPVCVTTVFNT